MIDVLFYFGESVVIVKIKGRQIFFGHNLQGAMLAPLKDMQLNRAGVLREFPDLTTAEDWREQAIERFQAHVDRMKTEEDIAHYVIDDLRKFGYIPKMIQRAGFRPRPIN